MIATIKISDIDMEISHLRTFQTVADSGTVSGAARVLNCVQSNVTARIKNLEEELGVQLFYRKPRGMIVTPAGRLLTTYARQMIHLEKEIRTVLSDGAAVRGQLVLGAFESVAAIRLPVLLADFHTRYPEVEISLITGTSTELNRKVLDYDLDGAFVTDGYRLPDMVWSEAFQEELVLVCPSGAETADAVAGKGVLVFPRPCAYRDRLEQWLRGRGLSPKKTIEMGSTDGMIKCISAGMGVGILPFSTVERASELGVISVRRIDDRLESVPVMFVKRRDTLVSKPLGAFLDLLGP